MIGVIVVAHGKLATSMVETVQMFTGKTTNLASVDLPEESGPETFYESLNEKVKEVDQGSGVLILADLMGGTPGNNALRLMAQRENIAVLTGVNLTMLLEAMMARNNTKNLSDLAEQSNKSSKEGIKLYENKN